MQLMHMLNCLYSSISSGDCRYSPLGERLLRRPDDPGLDPHQLLHEVAEIDDEISDHGEVAQRLDAHRPGA